MSEPLPERLVAALAEPVAYPADASARRGVTHVQTHISHVFLTAERVYKLRKAVSPGFLDFATRAARNTDCERELRLNRRLAPDVYLGVAPLEGGAAGYRVGGHSATEPRVAAEHVVVMRRLPAGGDALSLLARGALAPAHVLAAAARIAAFHRAEGLGAPAPWTREAWLARIDRPMRDNLVGLARDAVAAALAPPRSRRSARPGRWRSQRAVERSRRGASRGAPSTATATSTSHISGSRRTRARRSSSTASSSRTSSGGSTPLRTWPFSPWT